MTTTERFKLRARGRALPPRTAAPGDSPAFTAVTNPDMTVSYTLEVADARFGGFCKLLLRWKGSIYKLLYKDFLLFCGVYVFFSVFYRFLLSPKQQDLFERIALYCDQFTNTNFIPVLFVLGESDLSVT
ncbi:hypothetical protein F7725_011146 [Dissostichus mawsoni]|uniref:Bestrophin homolog n=1 Tax=Dissostichus mawsoni TaxID=36200 RepID=A0A7J5Z880_DISMA|nr:hypothetical protein F7725_011146 [Dissostichus mawsoni]